MAVKVPAAVLQGIEVVRESGLVNMEHANVVAALAFHNSFVEAANWIAANRELYLQGLVETFEVEEADGD